MDDAGVGMIVRRRVASAQFRQFRANPGQGGQQPVDVASARCLCAALWTVIIVQQCYDPVQKRPKRIELETPKIVVERRRILERRAQRGKIELLMRPVIQREQPFLRHDGESATQCKLLPTVARR